MKRKFISLFLSVCLSISFTACGNPKEEQTKFDQEMTELNQRIQENKESLDSLSQDMQEDYERISSIESETEDEPENSFTDDVIDMGISVDDFLDLYLSLLEENDICPNKQKDLDSIYFLYFNSSSNNQLIKIIANESQNVSNIIIDKDLNDFIIIFQSCLELLGISSDAESFLQELNDTTMIESNGFVFINNDDFYSISSNGGTLTDTTYEHSQIPDEDKNESKTLGEQNALSSASDYLDYTAFSYSGLIEQLEYEGFSSEEATYAADNCGADWNEQAAKCAENYISISSFSRSGLIEQLEFEGFTKEQAEYGVKTVGY